MLFCQTEIKCYLQMLKIYAYVLSKRVNAEQTKISSVQMNKKGTTVID